MQTAIIILAIVCIILLILCIAMYSETRGRVLHIRDKDAMMWEALESCYKQSELSTDRLTHAHRCVNKMMLKAGDLRASVYQFDNIPKETKSLIIEQLTDIINQYKPFENGK